VSLRIAGPGQGNLSHISAVSAWAEEWAFGRQQQKHAGGAPGAPNRRGDDA
jgi:hypothetical protein